jgi:hypothetical protein
VGVEQKASVLGTTMASHFIPEPTEAEAEIKPSFRTEIVSKGEAGKKR